jgi:divalent metal cation (Fe/Co/Zn/Cd) transporter
MSAATSEPAVALKVARRVYAANDEHDAGRVHDRESRLMGLIASYVIISMCAGLILLALVAAATREWPTARDSMLGAVAMALLLTVFMVLSLDEARETISGRLRPPARSAETQSVTCL